MPQRALAAFLLSVGLSLAFSSASCETCPKGQQSCGDSYAAAAGADGSNSASCELLTAMRSCMDTFCMTASNPFCDCYKQGRNLTTDDCTCIAFDAKLFCDQAVGIDAASYDCGAASSAVSSYCVPVR